MLRRTPSGSSTAINRLFREHPLRTPLLCIAIGVVLLFVWDLLVTAATGHARIHVSPYTGLFLMGGGSIVLIIGVLTLPFGIITVIRRRRNRISLVCPACRYAGKTLAFRVHRDPKLRYAVVTCPQCSWEFTVDKFARIT